MFWVKPITTKQFTKKFKYDLFGIPYSLIQKMLQSELKLQKYEIHDLKIMITQKLHERDFEQH